MEMEIYDSDIHEHRLILRDIEKKNDEDECCFACTLPISSTATASYGCNQCKDFVLHRSCALLPKQIYHPFHPALPNFPRHRLTLLYKIPGDDGKYCCSACSKYWETGFTYHCAACNFYLDLGCASQVTTIKYEGHDHLLTLFDKNYYHYGHLCSSCHTTCVSSTILRCVYCNFNVHKSCVPKPSIKEFPKQIQHPFHPLHPLTLTNHPKNPLTCKACKVSNDDFSFRCEECNFTLGVECTSLAPTIKYENHDHLLTFLDNIEGFYKCDSCYDFYRHFIFRCVECNFNLHPSCFPSLRSIQHECHIHPLTLMDPVALTDFDDASSGFYCDACEKDRNPKEPCYYCVECNFAAHIKCVIYKVLPALAAEQESDRGAKKENMEPASDERPRKKRKTDSSNYVEGFIGASHGKVGINGITENHPTLTKLDEEIEKLRTEVKEETEKLGALTKKLEALEGERAQYVESKMKN